VTVDAGFRHGVIDIRRRLVHRLDHLDARVWQMLGEPCGERGVSHESLDLADMGDAHRCASAQFVASATSMTLRALAMIACAACTSR